MQKKIFLNFLKIYHQICNFYYFMKFNKNLGQESLVCKLFFGMIGFLVDSEPGKIRVLWFGYKNPNPKPYKKI
jgi:hypothetical protein